jgi:hypothetical protein
VEILRGERLIVSKAQQALYHRALCNRAAKRGEYNEIMENILTMALYEVG